jgi:hypothetical protein
MHSIVATTFLMFIYDSCVGIYLISVTLSILATIFVLSTVFYLAPRPHTLLSSYYYQIYCIDVVATFVLSICHQDM